MRELPAGLDPAHDRRLKAGWAIFVGMAISVKVSEVRVAQQLGTLASFPPVGLIVIDLRVLRTVSRMFDRERLVTGAKGHQGGSIFNTWSIAAASGRLISSQHARIHR